jgi:hypothetical protein
VRAEPTTYEERLQLRIVRGGPDAVEAAVAMMERHDPVSLEQAQGLAHAGTELQSEGRDAVAEAWDHYFHIRSMSWD